jgi:hypothetical protein
MAVRLPALHAGQPLPSGRFLVLIFSRGSADLRAIVQLEGFGQLKNPMTSLTIEHATLQLAEKCQKINKSEINMRG